MALEDLSLADVLDRSYARAVLPAKAIRLVQAKVRQSSLSSDLVQIELSDAFLRQLSQSRPSSLCSAYLTEGLLAGVLDAQAFAIQFLFALKDTTAPQTVAVLAVAASLLGTQWAMASDIPLASVLSDPRKATPPDIGTSASADAPEPVPTMSLLMPLLQLCASTGEAPPPPVPISALVVRLLMALQPYPAPPLKIGIEASGLLTHLPEAINVPLRNCLGGLMADLAMSQTAAALNLNAPPVLPPADRVKHGDLPPLPLTFPSSRDEPPIPISQMVSFLLTWTMANNKYARAGSKGDSIPWSNHIIALRAGRYIASPDVFLLNLIGGSLQLLMGTHQTITPELTMASLWVTEWLPGLLRYWKDTSTQEWPYPSTLIECLSTSFEASSAGLTAFNAWKSSLYTSRLREAEAEDEGGVTSIMQGLAIEDIQSAMLRRLRDLELLDDPACQTVLPGFLGDRSVVPGLLSRTSSASRSALAVLDVALASVPGVAQSFAAETAAALAADGPTSLPEGLLPNLCSRPSLLASLCCKTPPIDLLAIYTSSLLDSPIDEGARADDPQGVLTRFGEGVVFIEALADVFDLELPRALAEARAATCLGHLDTSSRACLSGWVKALFSSEGIDDNVMQSTMPIDLYRLAPSIVSQAITAAAAGQIDRDALHGGLSYFSQPLLSWCLGGIIAWLCDEIIRNGLISALHLDVLQTVVLSDSIPEVLLRINSKGLHRILDPALGLAAVFQAANFDSQAVKGKLEGIAGAGYTASLQASLPLNVLRSQLHIVRHLDMAQQPWAAPFLTDVKDCLASEGPGPMINVMLSELVNPSMEYDGSKGDPLSYLVPLLCAIPIENHLLLLDDLVSHYIPRNIERAVDSGEATKAYALCGLAKSTLLLADWLHQSPRTPATGASPSETLLSTVLADDLEYYSSLAASPEDGSARRTAKRRKSNPRHGVAYLGSGGKAIVQTMRSVLGADEELRTRWPELRILRTK